MGWWWLSYADDDGFRGGVFVEAPEFLLACLESRVRGLSPGGQVQGTELPGIPDDSPYEPYKLYSREDVDPEGSCGGYFCDAHKQWCESLESVEYCVRCATEIDAEVQSGTRLKATSPPSPPGGN